ncbi:hypothetical protein SERLADRAFT_434090 [Serpula lacrymans var. lacrymans S7.9]|uniref:Uncharacterized protein n=1 Tax=Serpula lacrymans var. lacrymans (strain S7.9) TaxID=578457 RepID=F8NLN5_SERL9|nr:uncharacterized protein SERLADRAFT_434090 [Serpula lacrymans var. lacrymans S7.9]EGO28216.1 hypothetical protein SERLADRAFT_434090 [Serpula lacrymans var. lacrymans S7.9]
MIPGFKDQLTSASISEDDIEAISKLALKGSIIDWITPKAQNLDPPLHQNIKSTQGFGHPQTKLQSGETLVTSDQWPLFLYAGLDYDSTDPWKGLLRNNLFVLAYKHIFLSPSSVNSNTEARATHSSNARLHGMHQVTRGSIAYIATQVHFALLAQSVFSRTDTITDSEGFFNSILGLLQDPNEIEEDNDLLAWWNHLALDVLKNLPQGGKLSWFEDNNDGDEINMEQILDGSEALDISHAGGEFEALASQLKDNIWKRCFKSID